MLSHSVSGENQAQDFITRTLGVMGGKSVRHMTFFFPNFLVISLSVCGEAYMFFFLVAAVSNTRFVLKP